MINNHHRAQLSNFSRFAIVKKEFAVSQKEIWKKLEAPPELVLQQQPVFIEGDAISPLPMYVTRTTLKMVEGEKQKILPVK